MDEPQDGSPVKWGQKKGLTGYQIMVTMVLIMGTFGPRKDFNLDYLSRLTLELVAMNVVIVAIVVTTAIVLMKSHWFFRLSWAEVFKWKESENFDTAALAIPVFGIFFALLFFFNLPTFAYAEEHVFRRGVETWDGAIVASFIFGMVHVLVGVPIGVGVALSIAGLWFSSRYFDGGIELSTLHHVAYNSIVLSVGFVVIVIDHGRAFKSWWKKIHAE